MRDTISATFETDLPLPDHAYVLINGKTYQVSEMPAWTRRPWRQPALWVSEESARVLEWAMTIEAEDESVRQLHRRRPRQRGEFSQREAMDHFLGDRPHEMSDEERQYRRDWWDTIRVELRDANLLVESGWFAYKPSQVAWDFFPQTPEPQVRRLF